MSKGRTGSRDDYSDETDSWCKDENGEETHGEDYCGFENRRKNVWNDGVDYTTLISDC